MKGLPKDRYDETFAGEDGTVVDIYLFVVIELIRKCG